MKNIGIEKSCDIFLWMLIMGGGKFWNYKGIQCSSRYLLAYILEDKVNYVNLSFKDYDRRYFKGNIDYKDLKFYIGISRIIYSCI